MAVAYVIIAIGADVIAGLLTNGYHNHLSTHFTRKCSAPRGCSGPAKRKASFPVRPSLRRWSFARPGRAIRASWQDDETARGQKSDCDGPRSV
jgi:hypothetical protein